MGGIFPFSEIGDAQRQRDEEEQIRQLLEQQHQVAEQLKSSGFGAWLQGGFQPPPPAQPPPSGIMGTVGQALKDIFIGAGDPQHPAGLIQEEYQQKTLNEVFKQQAEREKETARQQQQTARDTEMESRRAATQSDIETRQQARLTEAEARRAASAADADKRLQMSLTEAEARRAASSVDAEKRQIERDTARAAEQKTAAETRAQERAYKKLDSLVTEGTNSKAEVDLWNDILTRYPRPGFNLRKWEKGTWAGMLPFTAGSRVSKAVEVEAGGAGGAAATAAKAAATPSTLSDAELKKRLGL